MVKVVASGEGALVNSLVHRLGQIRVWLMRGTKIVWIRHLG